LAAVILLAWVSLQIFGGGERKADKPATTAKSLVTAVPTTPAPVRNGEVTVNLASGTGACDPEKVLITPSVKSGQYVGGAVRVTMSVSTTQKDPCVLDAKAADLLVVISANKAPVWDSSVCKSALLTGPVSVTPTWATVVETTWTGRGSGKNCSVKEGFASPGSYVLKAATLGGEIGQTSFSLRNKPKPKAAKTTTPPATPSAGTSDSPQP
jgi:hypothetical protein